MYRLSQLRELHIELTERCNAHCPMCGRFDSHGGEIAYLTGAELSLEDLRRVLPPTLLSSLRSIRLCGNFGDPAAARDTLQICEWIRSVAPGMVLQLHTNGSLREPGWWFDLGRLFRGPKDAVHFALDGLEDTHALYRRRTSFEKVMTNAEAFIRGGGNASWVFLVFAHNEHQVAEAEQRAARGGFKRFSVKTTKRFLDHRTLEVRPSLPIVSATGSAAHGDAPATFELKPPAAPELSNRGIARLQQLDSADKRARLLAESPIECRAQERRGAYVSATGHLFPCCWVGASVPGSADSLRGTIRHLLAPYGGLDALSLFAHPFEEILSGPIFTKVIPESWRPGDGRLAVCGRTCGVELRTFDDQFLTSAAGDVGKAIGVPASQ